MELRHLRYFLGVARELSFTRAAQKLRVAQPALSRQIRQLEEELGAVLIDRSSKSIQLTQSGVAFRSQAEAIIAQTEQAVSSVRDLTRKQAGSLNIGYVWGLFHSSSPGIIARFRSGHPGVAVHLFDHSATEQAAGIQAGKLDAGFIGLSHEADTAGLDKLKIGECQFLAVLPRQHPAAKRRTISLGDLSTDLFLVISDESYPGAARVAREACHEAGFKPRVFQTAERGHTILGMIAANCGVALLPEPLKRLPHSGVVFRPLENPPTVPLYVAWNGRRPSTLRDTFLRFLQSVEKK